MIKNNFHFISKCEIEKCVLTNDSASINDRKTDARPFYTIHDILRCLSLVQLLRKAEMRQFHRWGTEGLRVWDRHSKLRSFDYVWFFFDLSFSGVESLANFGMVVAAVVEEDAGGVAVAISRRIGRHQLARRRLWLVCAFLKNLLFTVPTQF